MAIRQLYQYRVASRKRHKVRRAPRRASYEREVIDAILDEALVCHVGLIHDGYPVVTPTLYARTGDELLLHGSAASRTSRHLAEGGDACVSVTLVDGLVLARSAFHHSVNYRSVTLFARGQAVDDPDEKLAALEAFVDRLHPGRWAEVRTPSAKELAATAVVRVRIDEASAKVRTGPPVDEERDYELDVWAGTVPIRLQRLAPVADPRLPAGIGLPPSLRPPAEGASRARREGRR
jgi:nitroimidazol reductase NimA-like FMN-containing flavoprotein (pyridoxamine 5'-phosphate oxidase superfamily)